MPYRINFVEDFTDLPGARWRKAGPLSGEEFRDNLLEPAFLKAVAENDCVEINFYDAYGYAPCFLEEAFGGLVRKHPDKDVLAYLKFIGHEDYPRLKEDIEYYIAHALPPDKRPKP